MKFSAYSAVFSLLATFVYSNCQSDITISSLADVERIASCTNYNGTIKVTDFDDSILNIPGLRTVSGNFEIIENPKIFQININSLQSVSGNFSIVNNTQVVAISTQALTRVGNYTISNAPMLGNLNSANVTEVDDITVILTMLRELSFFSAEKANNIEISNNQDLGSIVFANLTAVTGSINIADNMERGSLDFGKLETVQRAVTFRNLLDVNVSSIVGFNETLNLFNNFFTNFSLDSLSEISRDITVANNSFLTFFTIPKLSFVNGGIRFMTNQRLEEITEDFFPTMSTVRGGVTFTGNISRIYIPSLESVHGAVLINSTHPDFECSDAAPIRAATRGNYRCEDHHTHASRNAARSSSNSFYDNLHYIIDVILLSAGMMF